jgi:hypothetical protein
MLSRTPSATEMLKPEHAAEYGERLTAIWHELIWVRQSMHIVNSIVRFPLQQFAPPEDIGFFWQVIVNNCGNAVVLTLHSLVNDNENTLNLRRFANAVLQWLRPEHVASYRGRLGEARFDPTLNKIAERMRALRHQIAHVQLQPAGATRPAISEAEAERLYLAVKSLFRATCHSSEYVIDEEDYRVGKPEPRTIDRLLDLVAKDSRLVNLPEKRGQWWPVHREHMDPEKIEEMNRWRTKFNLPPA